jgi:hypothetical protein
MSYEYKVVPAPTRGVKAKGVKTPEDRFAHALESAMNELASDGWEYLRADTLPCEQREGLMSKTTVFQNMLVFRRGKALQPVQQPQPPAIPAPRPKTERSAATQPHVTPQPPEPPKAPAKPVQAPAAKTHSGATAD